MSKANSTITPFAPNVLQFRQREPVIANDLAEELEYIVSEIKSGRARGIAYCIIDRHEETTIGIGGEKDADKMCDGLAELVLHMSQTRYDKP